MRFGSLAAAAVVLSPIVTLIFLAMGDSEGVWQHLMRTVLPGATRTTLWLLTLVSISSAIVGVVAAYLVVAFDFPLRRTLSWALVLPFAVPPYLAAYALGEFFHYTGPVQTFWRGLFGYQTIRDYWFPDIRSTWGAALVMTSVLYPYVYLTTRVVFLMQARSVADAARILGAGRWRVFFTILLPLARPAIIGGVALVLMETLNDIGASEYLGVKTLTSSVYATWLARGSLAGGAQIALMLLVLVVLLLVTESWARRRQKFSAARGSQFKSRPARQQLTGWRAGAATTGLLLPIAVGFGVPLYVFGRYVSRRMEQIYDPRLLDALTHSIFTAAATAIVTVSVALFLLYAMLQLRDRMSAAQLRAASVGYALPGGVLALGLLFLLGRIDNLVDGFAREYLGFSTGLLFMGSAAAVVLACSIRFVALAEATIRSGYEKLPPNLDAASRSLGRSSLTSAWLVTGPLLMPAILTAAVLVFVDAVKELSATILLRPFGFNTLATYTYEQASRSAPEEGAFAALLIVAVSVVPVVLLSRMLARDQESARIS